VSCRHHLLCDVDKKGRVILSKPGVECEDEIHLEMLRDTCSLDVAERGEHAMTEIGRAIGVSKQRIKQILEEILERGSLKRKFARLL